MTPDQLAKAVKYNQKECDEGDFTGEMIARLVEFWQDNHQLKGDGFCGPLTQKSIQSGIDVDWAPHPSVAASVRLDDEAQFVNGKWLPWDGPQTSRPATYKQAKQFFGDPETSPGSEQLDKKWHKASIIECHEKLGNRLPGVSAKWWVQIHRTIEPYLREALRRASLSCPEYQIERVGGFNFRHIRHNPDNPLSMHAFGCAIDIDPDRNNGIQFKAGQSPSAWSPEYYRYWPKGVPPAFVQAMKSCGFAWGNDWDSDGQTDDHTWLDPMHFEWIARGGNQFNA